MRVICKKYKFCSLKEKNDVLHIHCKEHDRTTSCYLDCTSTPDSDCISISIVRKEKLEKLKGV